MPALSKEEKALLGPPISPFERSLKKPPEAKVIRMGEDQRNEFEDYVHDAIEDDKPKIGYAEISLGEIQTLRESGRFREKCFLWVIDGTTETIRMIRETTRNALRAHDPVVCHTNLTGGGPAYVGGELFFCEDGSIYLWPKSDRYGFPSQVQWQVAVTYFRRVGYQNVVDISDWLR